LSSQRGHDAAVEHEGRDPGHAQTGRALVAIGAGGIGRVGGNGVGRDEGMRGVASGLGPLRVRNRVLDGMGVEGELPGQRLKVDSLGVAEIDPHQTARLIEIVGDTLELEVLLLEDSVSP
jgi:hypothetical protein